MEKSGSRKIEQNLSLFQQFKNLEKDWDSFKNSKPKTLPRYSTDGNLTSVQNLFENSPTGLMSSLQNVNSPSDSDDGFSSVKNYDMEVEEILKERRSAIVNGKLKGRKLFPEEERESEVELDWDDVDEGSNDGLSDLHEGQVTDRNTNTLDYMIQTKMIVMTDKREKSCKEEEELGGGFDQTCSFSGSSLSEETMDVKGENSALKVNRVPEKLKGHAMRFGGGSFKVAMAWFTIVSVLFVLGLISMSCNGKYLHDHEVILAPT